MYGRAAYETRAVGPEERPDLSDATFAGAGVHRTSEKPNDCLLSNTPSINPCIL